MWYNALNLPSTRFPREWPSNAYKRTHFGQHILWHEYQQGGRHLSAEKLEPYRQQGDESVDHILELFEQEGRTVKAGDDLLERASLSSSKNSQADAALAAFVHHHSQVPTWVDVEQLKRGQNVFLAYLPAISISLYYRSLVPGFSIPKIAAVLSSTGYLAPPAQRHTVRERLMDTGALIGACLEDGVECLLPNGYGWKTALRVRILHAKVRRTLLKRKGLRKWNTQELGIPINQEDMAATLLAFSTNALLGCEMILGRPLPIPERLDYLALWRYIGWLLGVNVNDNNDCQGNMKALDPCGPGWIPDKPDALEHSYAIFQSIIFHILQPGTSSTIMSHHLLRQGRRQDRDGESQDDQINADNWFYFRSLQCRRFVGGYLADALQLPFHPKWWGRLRLWVISTVYLSILTVYTVAGLPWSPLRDRIIAFHQRKLHKFMTHWNESHPKRMKDKLKSQSACPFSMVSSFGKEAD